MCQLVKRLGVEAPIDEGMILAASPTSYISRIRKCLASVSILDSHILVKNQAMSLVPVSYCDTSWSLHGTVCHAFPALPMGKTRLRSLFARLDPNRLGHWRWSTALMALIGQECLSLMTTCSRTILIQGRPLKYIRDFGEVVHTEDSKREQVIRIFSSDYLFPFCQLIPRTKTVTLLLRSKAWNQWLIQSKAPLLLAPQVHRQQIRGKGLGTKQLVMSAEQGKSGLVTLRHP